MSIGALRLGRSQALRLALLTLGSVAAPTATGSAAPVNKQGIGESVGSFERIECPRPTYLVGIKTVVNHWLDYVQIYCAGTDAAGDWTTTASPPKGRSFVLRGLGFDPNQIDLILANTHVLDCPLDTHVTGFDPGAATVTVREGEAQVVHTLPWHTMLQCRGWRSGVTERRGYAPVQWGSDPAVSGRLLGWDGVGGARSCQAHEVGVGVWTMVSDNIRQLGLVCARFDEVRPGGNVPLAALKTVLPKAAARSVAARQVFPDTATPLKGSVWLSGEHSPLSGPEGRVVGMCERQPWLCRGRR